MKQRLFILLFAASIANATYRFDDRRNHPQHHAVNAEWAIIGAGPAGIAAVGVLLDLGVDASSIIWVDPEFNVGRLGKYYSNVPSNVEAERFLNFVLNCKAFALCCSPSIDLLKEYDHECECPLYVIINPLRDITAQLRKKVLSIQGCMTALDFIDDVWHVHANDTHFTANHVVLATGSQPKTLPYGQDKTISLDLALDKYVLSEHVTDEDTVGVVGNAHSGVLILKSLTELEVPRIISFEKHPIQFYWDEGCEASGLQGITAVWAEEHLTPVFPPHIIRIKSDSNHLQAWVPICDKIIYAIGYERNPLPPINGKTDLEYNDKNGTIMPRLFGLGIAFPKEYISSVGNKESEVGLQEFLIYAQKVMPEWMKRTKNTQHLAKLKDLLQIDTISL